MFRLAHLSDIHLGPLPQVSYRELASKRVTGYINWRRNRARHMHDGVLEALISDLHQQSTDHVAVTGDLVNLSLETEFAAATDWLTSLGDASDITVIPGNHDSYVPGALAHACKSWAPWMTGDDGNKPLQNRDFPFLRIRDGIALIGASSATASAPFRATGRLGRLQAKRLAETLEQTGKQGLLRIVLIHHPPVHGAAERHKRLYGISRFQSIVREHGCELVLHGHTHLATIHHIDGPRGPVPVVGVPSASQGLGARRPAARYNLFDISGTKADLQIRMFERGIVAGRSGVVEISDRLLTG